jgi:hypothetical protein
MPVITGRGINFSDLSTLFSLIATKLAATCVKLDADALTESDYATTCALSSIPTGADQTAIRDQGVLLTALGSLRTAFNLMLTKLDASGGGVGTNYSSLWAMGNYIENGLLGSLQSNGIYDGAIIRWLSDYLTKWNGVVTKLDADGGIAAVDYVTTCGITAATYIDATGCSHRPVADA